MNTNYHSEYLINGSSVQGVSVLDRAFAYGDGVFRTLPVKHNQPVNWALHYAKLQYDCRRLKLNCPNESHLVDDIHQLFKEESTGVAKIVISRGIGDRGYAIPTHPELNRIVIKLPSPIYPAINADEGVKLFLCSLRLSKQPMLAGIKHLNRLENIMARMEWSDPEYADGLLLDQNGFVIEGTMSNVFARFGNQLVTPDLTDSGVDGVTRGRILTMSNSLGLSVSIKPFSLEALLNADEVILCNSLFGAWQVRSLCDKFWPKQALAKKVRDLLES